MISVTQLALNDGRGGAARAAHRLHVALRRNSVDSRMLVMKRQSTDDSIDQFVASSRLIHKCQRRMRACLNERHESIWPRGRDNSEVFSQGQAVWGDEILRQSTGDVINCHWVSGLFEYGYLRRIKRPIVLTLHDMNPFTGGCHFDNGCERFTQGCGSCPQLTDSFTRDASWRTWKRRMKGVSRLAPSDLVIAAPSHWMAEQARRSTILGKFHAEVIPNSVDTRVFAPRDAKSLRRRLGILDGSIVIGFAASLIGSHRKGVDLLASALAEVSRDHRIHLIVSGAAVPGNRSFQCPVSIHPPIGDDEGMAELYSALDFLVVPSRQDNLPNTAIEALACGTPVVAFRVGGLPDIIQSGQNGLLVNPECGAGLRDAINFLCRDPRRLHLMSMAARSDAIGRFSEDVQARRYTNLYRVLLDARDAGGSSF